MAIMVIQDFVALRNFGRDKVGQENYMQAAGVV